MAKTGAKKRQGAKKRRRRVAPEGAPTTARVLYGAEARLKRLSKRRERPDVRAAYQDAARMIHELASATTKAAAAPQQSLPEMVASTALAKTGT